MPEATQTEPKLQLNLSDEQLKNMRQDMKNIDKDLEYRAQFEPAWIKAINKWNLVAPEGLKGTPNYVVPVSRMATYTGVVAMRRALPDVKPVPEGSDEKEIAYLLGEASAHVHRMTNMEAEMDLGMVDFAVMGNMVLQSFVNVPYKTKSVPVIENGKKTRKKKKISVRDWSRPKIGTKAVSPWECAFGYGARNSSRIRRCWWQEKMSKAEFDERCLEPDSDYFNTELVEEGKVWSFDKNGKLDRISVDHDRIIIDHVQNELDDSWRQYANGVLIYDESLSGIHCHGKITLSLIPNHHKYDKNGKTPALYGAGDPELLEDLDDLINAAANLFVYNYKLKSTYVVGVEGGLAIDEIDLMSGMPIQGKVSVQSLGAADLPEWDALTRRLEQWCIQMVKKNYMRLEGEVAKTAYEAAQKKQDENVGLEYQSKKMESGGLYEYMRKHISDIMEHFTVEEWADVTDRTTEEINELIKAKEMTEEDVIWEEDKDGTKTPAKIRYIEQFRTRGRVFEDDSKDGKRDINNLREKTDMQGQDGWLPAEKKYLHTRKWRLFKKVPDLYLVGKTILGQDDLIELSKIEQMVNNLTAINNLEIQCIQFKLDIGMDFDSMREKAITAIGSKREEFLPDNQDQEDKDLQEAINKGRELLKAARTPPPNVLPAVQGGTPNLGADPALGGGPQAPQVVQ